MKSPFGKTFSGIKNFYQESILSDNNFTSVLREQAGGFTIVSLETPWNPILVRNQDGSLTVRT